MLLPPTSDELSDDNARPYFLWWTDASVGDLRRHLSSEDADERAYWLGALLREANTRDVWAFVRPEAVTALWPKLVRHLGRMRPVWAYLLGLDDGRVGPAAPPVTKQGADDLVHEALPDLEPPPPPVEGVLAESLLDLRASKLTCLLSRSEPRDLVDLLFLDSAGYAPERDLPLALRKDSGIDPGMLAWLLRDFPVSPLPQMLEPLIEADLVRFRDALAERFRRIATP